MVPLVRLWPRPFRLLTAGQMVSLLGDGMANVALIYAVLRVSSSATGLGLVFASQWLPLVVFSLVGGVLSDRVPRRDLRAGWSEFASRSWVWSAPDSAAWPAAA